jgi:methylthioribose-1-phosphate isomerase
MQLFECLARIWRFYAIESGETLEKLPVKSLEWKEGQLHLLDQTLLPGQVNYVVCSNYRIVADAITRLVVRGAPAIGAAAAFAMVLGAKELADCGPIRIDKLIQVGNELKATRPTAVNLAWAVDLMLAAAQACSAKDTCSLLKVLEAKAVSIADRDKTVNEQIGKWGASLFTSPTVVLTHCNAGSLATVDFGTALGVVRQAFAEGNITGVYVDETRPLLQGARLTAFELSADNIPVTVITDNMAGWVMKQKKVGAVIVGADRIARNGDVANKIGTYSVAVLAKEHGIPFYVAAPVSTFDFSIATGEEIPIEERQAAEVSHFAGVQTVPDGVQIYNPAFDVTPAAFITAIITEHGILQNPYENSVQNLHNRKEAE